MDEGRRLRVLDAAASDDVEELKRAVGMDLDAIVLGLKTAIEEKSANSMKFLLESGIHCLEGGEKATKQSAEAFHSLVSAITTAVCKGMSSSTQDKKREEKSSEPISNVEGAIKDIKDGKFVIVQDAASRENEGDLIIAAEKVTPEKMAFMVNYTSGIICVGINDERCKELGLPQMVVKNTESHQTAFTVSVDLKHGTTTGISASDRAKTIMALTEPKTKPDDFARPGHIFPLRAKKGGVLERPGHTETSVDLPRMAGLYPAGVMSEIVNRDGSMARTPELQALSKRFGIRMITKKKSLSTAKRKKEPLSSSTFSEIQGTAVGMKRYSGALYRAVRTQ
eukprot:CAMPEP_0167792620 /NCGR_PEP_ID=MMETSP0111_2-20121227/12661_1 /TAXON_ID=91324 /ORGANISM="Lotharella globosa, Strain CCCM811" /LENGTH=337 /DNA_ID=CAMNT_0007685557 /DNA_START=16 /DNA_END=1030 /DNA_ORIENTATION=+